MLMLDNDVKQIAQICHEVNRAYCQSLGDTSQLPWKEAPQWQRDSAVKGVEAFLASDMKNTPEQMHASWLAHKQTEGWVHGLVKDAEKKTHPCMVPYAQLPPEQQVKDALFIAVVRGYVTPV